MIYKSLQGQDIFALHTVLQGREDERDNSKLVNMFESYHYSSNVSPFFIYAI